jgi:hypothetical protein
MTETTAPVTAPAASASAYKDVIDPLLARLLAIRLGLKKENVVERESTQMCIFFISLLFDLNSGAINGKEQNVIGIIENTMQFCEVLEAELGLAA